MDPASRNGLRKEIYRMELHIGATLRSLRKERGITQEELAKALGVTMEWLCGAEE